MTTIYREGLPPRERMPPCVRLARCDDRAASYFNDAAGCHKPFCRRRFWVLAGIVGEKSRERLNPHPDVVAWPVLITKIDLFTDDPAEAQAAYERAEVYVRTGELP